MIARCDLVFSREDPVAGENGEDVIQQVAHHALHNRRRRIKP